uniref:deazapurine DNA modification protein DpdA family protein n=1 Tax=Amycolatopsis sp. CA-096443 TaxID=3239919 RepID=UPI003F4909A2
MTAPPQAQLGIPEVSFIGRTDVPVMVSDARLRGRVSAYPKATGPVYVDSGGFNELKRHGRWTVPAEDYIARGRRCQREFGTDPDGRPWLHALWQQDWMCERPIIEGGVVAGQRYAGTRAFLDPGKVLDYDQLVVVHQMMTVLNGKRMRELAPDLPVGYVVQGDTPDSYVRCVDMFRDYAGIDLTQEPIVGVGSVCARQNTDEFRPIMEALHARGLNRLHTFGVKVTGLMACRDLIASYDSQTAYLAARYLRRRMPDCDEHQSTARTCANHLHAGLSWYRDIDSRVREACHRPPAARRPAMKRRPVLERGETRPLKREPPTDGSETAIASAVQSSQDMVGTDRALDRDGRDQRPAPGLPHGRTRRKADNDTLLPRPPRRDRETGRRARAVAGTPTNARRPRRRAPAATPGAPVRARRAGDAVRTPTAPRR